MWFWKQQLHHHLLLLCHPLLFLLYLCLCCFTPWKQQPCLRFTLANSVFQFQFFFLFNYTNCMLKYARFNDSVRSDAALRIIAQEIYTSLFHIYPLMPTTDTGFLPYRHIVIESTVLGCAWVNRINMVYRILEFTWVNRILQSITGYSIVLDIHG